MHGPKGTTQHGFLLLLWQRKQRAANAPQAKRQLVPSVAVIGRMPHLPIGETGVHIARSIGIGEQRIRHGVERLRQPTRQYLPRGPATRTDNSSLSIVLAVGFQRTGSNRGVPIGPPERVSWRTVSCPC